MCKDGSPVLVPLRLPLCYLPIFIPNLMPLAPSLLLGVLSYGVLPGVPFNQNECPCRKPARAARPSSLHIDLFHEYSACLTYSSAHFNIISKPKSINKGVGCSVHECIGDEQMALCHTDGSASPNPEPCPVDTSIFLCSPDFDVKARACVGVGTNNQAALITFMICLTEQILRARVTHWFSSGWI